MEKEQEDGSPAVEEGGGTELSIREENLADEIANKFYDPLDHIEPTQMKFVMRQVTTCMSDAEIGRSLGISSHIRRKWQKDPHVQAYKKQCMKRFSGAEITETARRQTIFIKEKLFDEVMDRLRDPEAAAKEYFKDRDPDNPPSVQEKMAYLERFATYASFDKLMKIWKDVGKDFRLDSGQATERTDDAAIEQQARVRFTKYKKVSADRKNLDTSAKKAVEQGLTWEEFQKQNAIDAEFEEVETNSTPAEEPDEEGVIEAEPMEEEEWDEISVEEWEIKRG